MKKVLRGFIYICLFTLCFALVGRFCRLKTDGFAIYKISSNLSPNDEYFIPALSCEQKQSLSKILTQPYTYLGKGAQCFVFASEDGHYVIKFFKQHNLRVPAFYRYLPLAGALKNIRDEKVRQKEEELRRDFVSYRIAYEHLKEETGLIFLHLNKTEDLGIDLCLYDKIGCIHHLPLDDMEFLVQKRAELFYDALFALIEKGDKAAAKERLTELVAILASRSMRGLYDKDPDINTNFGICDGKTVQIDVGRFRIDETRKDASIAQRDILRATDNLSQLLKEKDEELAKHLTETISHIGL